MKVLVDEELKEYIKANLNSELKKRFCFDDLMNFINTRGNRVCCLFGLRRTGKSTLQFQAIKELDNYGEVLYVVCDENDTIQDLEAVFDKYKRKYMFVDEVTLIDNFIGMSSMLANYYAMGGKKIILTGTDSLSFIFAKADALYDRVHMIHTTYISYKEFKHLVGKDIEYYIEYGGTLTNGETFYNNHNLAEYTNTAIVHNILHSLERWKQGRDFGSLYEIYSKGELHSWINKVLELHNRTFLCETINKNFESHDMKSMLEILSKRLNVEPRLTERMTAAARAASGIKYDNSKMADDKVVHDLTDYLEVLDLLYYDEESKEFIFTQPGMRYCQATNQIRMILKEESFEVFSPEERELMVDILDTDVKGKLLEDLVLLSLYKEYGDGWHKPLHFIKARDKKSREFDICICDFKNRKMIAIEVKWSKVVAEGQTKHLRDKEFCDLVEERIIGVPIINKAVLYRGQTKLDEVSDILYLNVEQFLCNEKEVIDALFAGDNSVLEVLSSNSNNSVFNSSSLFEE